MPVMLATKTLAEIDRVMEADQGASFRQYLGQVLPHMTDAYRGESFPFRSHLGASMIGDDCARKIWYGFRWAKLPHFNGRILRLFNRGHLEEARFIAMLLTIGVQVFQQDAEGNQYRISELGGHLGGSGDGICIGLPDLPAGSAALLEFKTHSLKSFAKLKDGVRIAKPEHYTQFQTYARKMGLQYIMYGAVCKDNDELHLEILYADPTHADVKVEQAKKIILTNVAPKRISESPAWWACKFCEYKAQCHGGSAMHRNCRTCSRSVVKEDGYWACTLSGEVLSKEQQFAACKDYTSL